MTWMNNASGDAGNFYDIEIAGFSIRADEAAEHGVAMSRERHDSKYNKYHYLYPESRARKYLDDTVGKRIWHSLEDGMTIDDVAVIAEALGRTLR